MTREREPLRRDEPARVAASPEAREHPGVPPPRDQNCLERLVSDVGETRPDETSDARQQQQARCARLRPRIPPHAEVLPRAAQEHADDDAGECDESLVHGQTLHAARARPVRTTH